MKKAIITGVTGQDGGYLAKLLLSKGYKVYGAQRRNTGKRYWRLDELGITDKIEFVDIDLGEPYNIEKVIEQIQPDEFYKCKFYQASTSEMYGKVVETPQRETTRFHPRSPYGCAKAYSHYLTQNYRESYGLFACSGILFNHESPMRGEEFVTRKITKGLVEWKHTGKVLELGNIESYRDWGHAEDYVEAMWLMLQQDTAEDYVISTGKTIQIKDFITRCLDELQIAYEFRGHEVLDLGTRKHIIKTNPKFFRPAEVDLLVGDSTKAKEKLLWKPKHTLETLVSDMIKEDLRRWTTKY